MSTQEWTEEQYETWKALWVVQNPHRNPPTWEQFRELTSDLGIEPGSVFQP